MALTTCHLCCIAHKKNTQKVDSADKSTTGSTSTSAFLIYDVPKFRHNSSLTSNPKVHYPAIDSLVLSLQCGKATAAFVSSRDRDFVAQVGKCASRSLDLFFLVLWPGILSTATPSMSSSGTYEHFSKNLVRTM